MQAKVFPSFTADNNTIAVLDRFLENNNPCSLTLEAWKDSSNRKVTTRSDSCLTYLVVVIFASF